MNIQHPDITRAERFGVEYDAVNTCDECNEPIYAGDDMYEDADGRCFCEECIKDIIADLPVDYVAEALGYKKVSV